MADLFVGGSDRLRVGLVGCGGRGTGAALQALAADPGAVLVAMADAFGDRLENSYAGLMQNVADPASPREEQSGKMPAHRIDVPEEARFVGFDACQRLLDYGVDVVLLASPPAFRPEHIRMAVDAGVHVFAEKPCAVDAPGVRSVLESARRAKEKNISLAHGFCWRAENSCRATYGELANGRIGDVLAIYATYLTGTLWHRGDDPDWTDMERQLRNWYYYTYLSGDHIVEQAVHSIDKILWAKQDELPIHCTALGGRQVRTEAKFGHIYDHFGVVYEFSDGALGVLQTRQQDGCFMENVDTVLGSEGRCEMSPWNRSMVIEGRRPWAYKGTYNNMYQTEHDELFAGIRSGQTVQQGVALANSTLMALMGRLAAYTGQRVTLEQALNSTEALTPSKWSWGEMPDPEVAMPGLTKLSAPQRS